MTGTRVQQLPQPADLLALHAVHPDRYPFLLESASGPSITASLHGRYDILFAFPGASLALEANGQLNAVGFTPSGTDFLTSLDRWFVNESANRHDNDLTFTGGWFLYFGYEFAGQIEPVLDLPSPPKRLPQALAVRCPAAVVHDRLRNRSVLVAEFGYEDRLVQMADDIAGLPQQAITDLSVSGQVLEEPPGRFLQAVSRILEYIRAGDVYQVNLSRRWQVNLERDIAAATLYRRLRQVNPAPFSGLMCWQGTTVLSSSPERLVRSYEGQVETRPIAGTHPRSRNQSADRQQAQALLGHPKERAEHIMLLDLERNDLGRICEPGSVKVSELMSLESYAHVHHIVSNVQGRLRRDILPGAIIRAVFPGGTITGCPKIRCMQIIAELENEGRGAYTGALGYLDRSGALDLNILIRSLVLHGRECQFRTGAGIVADSVPQRELEETRAKAKGLLQLFEAAS